MKWLVIIVVFVLLLGLFTLRLSNNKKTTNANAPVETTSVEMKNTAFSPSTIQVKVGDTVTFTNNDTVVHTITADDGTFDSGVIEPGKKYTMTFKNAGTISYHCEIYPNMKGNIEVK